MSESKSKKYNQSIILEHNVTFDLFKVFSDWLKTQINAPKVNYEKNALLNNPTFRFINPEGESIKIDDIRNFNQELAFSSYDNKQRYFIFFNADLTTLQAQNASLKSIEEPPENTQIVLLTTTIDKLLPTIISRCEVISLKKSIDQENNQDEIAKVYLQIIKSKHYQLIELANEYKEREKALAFFDQLLAYLYSELNNNYSEFKKQQLAKHLKSTLKTMDLLNQNANVKLTVENCFFDMMLSFAKISA